MQGLWEFDLTQESPIDGLKVEEIKRAIKENVKELEILLSYYFKDEGGLVEGVEVLDNIQFLAPRKGTLTVKFKVVYFNACWDIHSENKEEMALDFEVDPLQIKIKITGPNWPEREPDEI